MRVVCDLLKCWYVIRETHPIKLVQSLVPTNVNNDLARNEKIEKKRKKKKKSKKNAQKKKKKLFDEGKKKKKRNKEDIH